MQYRTFGKLDYQPSALGFGAMRLPHFNNDTKQIDEESATQMLHYAIDHGVNYVDTAYTYHGGESEKFLGRALQGGYRQRIRLATKLPTWLIEKPDDFDRLLDEQLERLRTDHIDFYLLHNLNQSLWERTQQHNLIERAEKARSDRRIHYLGFSFHDTYALFQQIIDAHSGWDFCQIQYNYMDVDYQAGRKGLQYAAAKGLGVVVMEPIRGGQLANNIPPAIQKIWDSAEVKRSPADWALQWVWNQPEVSLALSGMSTMAQVVENIASAERSGVNSMNEADLAVIARVRNAYLDLCPIPCTDCRYCLPCPNGVNIPAIFEIYNNAIMFDDLERAKMFYEWLDEKERANLCQVCEDCLELCPQKIEIPDWLDKVHKLLCK